MLAIHGFAMIATFMTAIMTRRMSTLAALILIPPAFALAAGFGPQLGTFVLDGVRANAATGVMLIFAILYFGLMIDAGLFDPLTRRIVAIAGDDPVRVTIGTAVLALIVSLDGDGSTTYLITVSAMLPLYRRLGMNPHILACIVMLCGGVMNLLPWGGPTARAAVALNVNTNDVFLELIPAMAITGLWVLGVAGHLGRREAKRLALVPTIEDPVADPVSTGITYNAVKPAARLFWFNASLTTALLVLLVSGALPLPVLFMFAFALALAVNYPSLEAQRERLAAHAGNALAVGGMTFAAGTLVGVLSGSGMADAMAAAVTGHMPAAFLAHIAPATGLLSAPFTFVLSNDAFFFGILPFFAKTAAQIGVAPIDMAQASLIGQQVHLLSPLVPSTYLLVGLVGIDFGAHLRFTLPWALGSLLVFFLAALAFNIVPIP